MATRKLWAKELQAQHNVSISLSCLVSGISRSAFYYGHKKTDDSDVIDVLNNIVKNHQRWGFPKCFKRIRALGHKWNHKRVYRIYTELKLNFRRKSKQRLPPRNPQPLTVPDSFGNTWSMDFMTDSLHNKVRFRTFNVIDDSNREALGIDIGLSMPSERVINYLDRLVAWHGYPSKIRVDNGSEFCSYIFTDWAEKHGIFIDYIKPGCPYQNAYIERFNRTYRHEVLDLYIFNNLDDVRSITEKWIETYNAERPHDSLEDLTPLEYKTKFLNTTDSTLGLC